MISRSAPPPLEPALVEESVESLAEILAHEHGGVCQHDQIALVVCVVKADGFQAAGQIWPYVGFVLIAANWGCATLTSQNTTRPPLLTVFHIALSFDLYHRTKRPIREQFAQYREKGSNEELASDSCFVTSCDDYRLRFT